MAQFVYVGSGAQAPLSTRVFDVYFERGNHPKEISSLAQAEKLRNNPSFIEVDDAKPEIVKPVKAPTLKTEGK